MLVDVVVLLMVSNVGNLVWCEKMSLRMMVPIAFYGKGKGLDLTA